MMTMMEERITITLLAKMLVLKGKASEMVYVSELRAHIILDLQ